MTRLWTPRRLLRLLAVTAAVLGAGLLAGYAIGRETTDVLRCLWGGLAAALPVLPLMIILADRRPRAALLGLVGIVAGSLSLALAGAQAIPPLAVGLGCVLVVGVWMRIHRAGSGRDLVEGLVVAYGCLAFIVELSIVLHNA